MKKINVQKNGPVVFDYSLLSYKESFGFPGSKNWVLTFGRTCV